MVKDIKLQQILERKVKWIEECSPFVDLQLTKVEKEEMKLYEEGERKSYYEMIYDSIHMLEEEFIKKYLGIVEQLKEYFERTDNSFDKVEVEQLSGYNNAIVFVLSLLNPQYEFENMSN